MSNIIQSLEDILKPYISERDRGTLDLANYQSEYRQTYFEYLPLEAAKDALSLFPCSERLIEKYLEIDRYFSTPLELSNDALSEMVYSYLKSTALIMEGEYQPAKAFIDKVSSVNVSSSFPSFKPGENYLHKLVYGALQNFILDELPEEKEYWILYDWSLHKTKWATASAYFLSDFFDQELLENTDYFRSAFELWASENSNRYWVEGNNFDSSEVVIGDTQCAEINRY